MKEIKIEVTDKCFRNCVHCSSDALGTGKKILDKNFIKRLLDEGKELGCTSVAFTGGEPTLYPHLDEVIEYAKKLGYYVKMYSMLTPMDSNIEYLQELDMAGLDEIIYSTGFALTRDGAVNLDRLKKFLPRIISDTNISLGIHHVITKYTLDDLIPALDLFLSLDKDRTKKFSLLRYIPHGRGDDSLLLTDEQLDNFKVLARDLYEKYPDKIRLGSPWNILGITHTKCNAAEENIIVGFDGNVYPCDAMKYFDYLGYGGNAHSVSLLKIYESEYFTKVRDMKGSHSAKCQKCPKFTMCEGGCLGQKMVMKMKSATTFEDYSYHARRTMNNFETKEKIRMNGEMGIIGEIGELVDLLKKFETHSLTEEKKAQCIENMMFEIGDIAWYLAASLSYFYGYSFADIGEYLTNSNRHNYYDEELIRECALDSDPLCINQVNRGVSVRILDSKYSFDIAKDWKKLPLVASQIISSDDKEEVLKYSAELMKLLAGFTNNILNMSIEDVLNMNIDKLKKRYEIGFDAKVANERIKQYDQYKKTEPEGSKQKVLK